MHYPVFMCGLHLEPARGNHVEHVNVVAEDVGFELSDSLASRNAAQMDEEQCADAASLVFIYHGKGSFAAFLRSAKVTPDAYDVFAALLAENRHYPHMLVEIQLGKAPQVLIAQFAFVSHEPMVHRLRAQAPSMLTQAFLVVGPDCADHNSPTIADGVLHPIRSGIEI
jgi:hypothetical protein